MSPEGLKLEYNSKDKKVKYEAKDDGKYNLDEKKALRAIVNDDIDKITDESKTALEKFIKDELIKNCQAVFDKAKKDNSLAFKKFKEKNSKDLEIKDVQKELKVNETGILDLETIKAIIKYQKDTGLLIDGLLGNTTLMYLLHPEEAKKLPKKPTRKKSSKGGKKTQSKQTKTGKKEEEVPPVPAPISPEDEQKLASKQSQSATDTQTPSGEEQSGSVQEQPADSNLPQTLPYQQVQQNPQFQQPINQPLTPEPMPVRNGLLPNFEVKYTGSFVGGSGEVSQFFRGMGIGGDLDIEKGEYENMTIVRRLVLTSDKYRYLYAESGEGNNLNKYLLRYRDTGGNDDVYAYKIEDNSIDFRSVDLETQVDSNRVKDYIKHIEEVGHGKAFQHLEISSGSWYSWNSKVEAQDPEFKNKLMNVGLGY